MAVVPDFSFPPFPRFKPCDCPHDHTCITARQLQILMAEGKSVRCRCCGNWLDPPDRGIEGRPLR